MDKIDRNIIREQQKNARLSNLDLAEKVNLSPSPCLRRVRKLETQGVITGYAAMVDQESYGLPLNVFVQIKLERHAEELMQTFEKRVAEIDEIMECYLITGSCDYLLHIVSDSLKSYESFMREEITTIPGIVSAETSFTFSTIKKKHRFPPLPSFD